MNSSDRLDQVLSKISEDVAADINNVLKCSEIAKRIQSFYLHDIDAFIKSHPDLLRPLKKTGEERKSDAALKDLFRGANFYCVKARRYFEFFGVNFDEPEKPLQFEIPNIQPEQLFYFLYSSVQQLHVILWEVLQDFLKPLEKLYFLRLCDSGVFPKDYPIFPAFGDDEVMRIDFVYDIFGRGGPLYSVSESLPFQLRFAYLSSDYFKGCFEKASKEIAMDKPEDFINDFIRLFVIRNNVVHIGKGLKFQESSEKDMQNLLLRLSTHLPRIQNSCIGIVLLFASLANCEPGTQA